MSGTVSDPTGAVVAGAEVVLLETGTSVSRSQPTNAAGQYVFVNLAPGDYRLTVTMQGFRQASVPSLRVEVAKAHLLNITLEVGAVAETVEVSAEARVELQTADSTVGNVLSGRNMPRMPTFTRQANEILTLQPGVTPGGEVVGSRSDQSTFALDGIDVTNQSVGGLDTYAQLFIDGIEEVRVSVANPNAAFGRGGGGQVSVVTRRGSNEFHGAVFWYHQNDNLNANTWTRKRIGKNPATGRDRVPEPELKDNRYGFRVGGPVIKDKTFLLLHYEGRNFPRSSDISRLVPTDSLRAGRLRFQDASGVVREYPLATSALCGSTGVVTCDPRGLGLSPTISALWAKLPPGNDTTQGDGLNTIGFRGTAGTPLDYDYYNIRLDHNLTAKWRVDASFRYFGQLQSGANLLSIIGGDVQSREAFPNRQNMANVGVTGQITPRLTGEFRFGWIRIRTATDRLRPNASAGVLAIPGTETTAENHTHIALDLGPRGGTQSLLGEPIDVGTQVARKQANSNRNFQTNADLTWVRGRHSLQFGTHIRYLPTLHLRDDKVLGSLGALVIQSDSEIGGSPIRIPASSRPRTCSATVTTNCVRATDVQQWNRLFTSSLGLIDNISILAVRDGDFKPLPFGSLLESDTTLWAPEFYVQDTWRITSALTLTFGVNYGWQTDPDEELGRYTIQINNDTGELLTARSFLKARREAAEKGQIFNPQFGFLPVRTAKRGVFDIDKNNWAPRLSAAWNPSFSGGFLGRLLGDRKTVIRGGYALIYDRQNTVQSVIVPSLGVAFAQTLNVTTPACNATGAGGPGCNATSTNPALGVFRVGRDGTIPVPTVPGQSIPVSPFWGVDPSGRLRLFPEILSFQVDPSIDVGKNHAVDVTWQRELPGNMLLEVGFAGRYARNLPQSMNLGQAPYVHVDTASGQTFAQAFDAVAAQLRTGVLAASVTPQPWFENNFPLGTRSLAAAATSSFINGDISGLFLTVDIRRMLAGLQPFNNYMAQTFFLRSSTGRSNYSSLFATLRKRMSHGLTFSASYTFSRSLDQIGAIQNAASVMPNNFDLNAEYGPSGFDITHLFNTTGLYELPFRGSSSALNKVIGGWYVSHIFRASSGEPLIVVQGSQVWGGTLFLGFSTGAVPTVDPSTFGNSSRSGVTGSNNIGTNSNPATGGSGLNLFQDPEAVFNSFRRVNLSTDGRSGRANPFRGMPRWNLDLSLGKRTSVTEKVAVFFSFDFFNIFNHLDFNNPGTFLTNSRAFGVITSQFTPASRTDGSRWIQFGLRVEF